jgi:hypothetical protein
MSDNPEPQVGQIWHFKSGVVAGEDYRVVNVYGIYATLEYLGGEEEDRADIGENFEYQLKMLTGLPKMWSLKDESQLLIGPDLDNDPEDVIEI